MSKDVRRLFAAQKAAKAGAAAASPTSSSSSSLSASASKRVTHPLAKYDPKTFRLTCAICGPAVPIKSDSLWNAHLVSKAHQEAVAKLRAVKEQMQRKEAEAAEQRRLQQQQAQAQAQGQGVKRKAVGGLVAYADDSESDSDDEETGSAAPGPATNSQSAVTSDFKRVKIDDEASEQDRRREQEQDIEEEEEAMAGLPAGFFDAAPPQSEATHHSIPQEEKEPEPEPENMEGVLPAGFFDNPEEDARVRAEVGGATADQQQRQVDAEFKALEAELARDLERQERQDAQVRSGQTVETKPVSTVNGASSEHIPYEEKVELEEQELEESIMARSEEEYLLFVEMQERLDALREKKNRLLAHQQSPGTSTAASGASSPSGPSFSTKSKPAKAKSKSILDLVREQELAKKEKERQAAAAFAKANADRGDSKMGGSDDNSDDDEDDSDEDDEDIEAMMDWRARRV